jgi:hypothetical protein
LSLKAIIQPNNQDPLSTSLTSLSASWRCWTMTIPDICCRVWQELMNGREIEHSAGTGQQQSADRIVVRGKSCAVNTTHLVDARSAGGRSVT